MRELFIKTRQAEKLKGLGFNDPCLAFISNGKFEYSPNNPNKGIRKNKILLPTWEQAFEFLMKRGYYKNIRFHSTAKNYSFSIYRNDEDIIALELELLSDYFKQKFYPSYEIARGICLDKLIEIIKNEQRK